MAIIHEFGGKGRTLRASVIVVNFNRLNLLRKCLESLGASGHEGVEVIVVDNGSSDGSAEMVEREFPAVRVVRSERNLGFCGGNNLGIAMARGAAIALLNNDAVAAPGWLEAMLREMEQDARVGMVAAKILVAGREGVIDKVGHGIYWDGQNRGKGSGEVDRGQYDTEREILWPDGCAALYRREMLEQTGGFDESFFAYADDAELGLRGRLMGWGARYAPEAVVYHERGATMGKYSAGRIRLIERNRVWLAVLHFPWWLLVLNPVFFLLRMVAGVLAGLAGQGEAGQVKGIRAKIELGLVLLKADLEALREIGPVLEKRRLWRRKRVLSDWQVVRLLWRHRLTLGELSRNLA
jgi:GT2 family glycosyltransferase